MHSNSLGCPKIFPLPSPVLYWLSHLTCISSLKAKTERKTLIYTQLKDPDTTKTFSLFLDQFLETHLRPIYCSLTCVSDNTAARVSARNLRSKLSARQCAYSHCRQPKTKQTKNCGCVALTRVGTVSVHSMLVSAFIGRTTPRRVERQCWHLKKTISGTGFQLMSSVTEGLKYGRLDPGLSLLMVKISDHYLLGYCHLVELWAKGNTGESFIWDLTTPQSKGSEMGETWLLLIKRIEKNWWKGEQLRLILWDT